MKEKQTDEEKQQIVMGLVMMDDAMFEAMCQSQDFVEELLQTILNEPKFRIIRGTLVPQKSVKNLRGRSIRMDAYVEGKEDSAFNIEVQKADDCNHVKRVRYNASVITSHNSQPGDTFDNIQKLCMVYISKKDFFGKGRNIYHAQTTIAETGDLVDNGLTEIYVNAEVKDGSRVSALMDVFNKKELSDADKKEFPNTYAKFNSLKHDKEEVSKMCDKIQQYADRFEKKGYIKGAIEVYVEETNLSEEAIVSKLVKRFGITEEDALDYYDEVMAVK